MNEREFYDDLWQQKVNAEGEVGRARDWIHRVLLDRISSPLANDRIEVAERMLRPGQRILDLGIWGGAFLDQPAIREKFPERFGLDLPQSSVEAAEKKGLRARVWNLNEVPYPFDAGYFDAVTLLAVLEHLFDPVAVVRELARLVRPGGQVVLALPNVASFSNRARLLLGGLPVTSNDPGWDGGHLHYFTIPETKRLLEESGLRVTHVGTSGGTQWVRSLWPSLLSGEFLVVAEGAGK